MFSWLFNNSEFNWTCRDTPASNRCLTSQQKKNMFACWFAIDFATGLPFYSKLYVLNARLFCASRAKAKQSQVKQNWMRCTINGCKPYIKKSGGMTQLVTSSINDHSHGRIKFAFRSKRNIKRKNVLSIFCGEKNYLANCLAFGKHSTEWTYWIAFGYFSLR